MISIVVLVIYICLATVTCRGISGCRESYYLFNGGCQPCPDNCVACIANTNCTKCTDNYYGVTCQQTCPSEQDCQCHKRHGYCTFGCPDGLFPGDSGECQDCPDNCESCPSSTDCVECKHRFYGSTCGKRCATHCETCNKTTGICLGCEEEYFIEDGLCLRCPDECMSCDDTKNCSRCKADYLEPDNGHCLKHCDMVKSDPFHCLNGYKESNTLTDEATACGCKKDLIGHDVVIRTRQPCMKYTSCLSTIHCLECGAMMIYQCNRTCHLENEYSCIGNSECSFVDGSMYSLRFCLNPKAAVSLSNISSTLECVAEVPPIDTTQSWMVPMLVLMSVVLMCVFLLLVIVSIRYRKLWTSRRKEVNNEEPINDEAMAMVCKKCEESTAGTDFNHPLQEETCFSNGSDLYDTTICNIDVNMRPTPNTASEYDFQSSTQVVNPRETTQETS